MLPILSRSIHQRGVQHSNIPLVIAVSGPHGSTGKTTVAINLALELASQRSKVLLIDADLQASSIANHFLLTDLPAGLPGALRIANQNRFDLEQLSRLSVQIPKSNLSVMPGFSSPPETEVPVDALIGITEVAKPNFDYTVIDLGCIKPGGAGTLGFSDKVFASADKQLFVCLADPIGIFRLLATEQKLLEIGANPLVIMNRVRNSVIESAKREITITLQRLSQLEAGFFLPDDPQQIDQAMRTGIQAAALSRTGAFRQAMTGFVRAEILGVKGPLDSRVAKLG
jgi:MinD-like ATPase involved in chromosome partitioning or flagellar assembly